MMNFVGMSAATSWVWLHIHWTFWGLAIAGFVGVVIWMSKHASKKDLIQFVWIALVVGILGGLLTAPLSMQGWNMVIGEHMDVSGMMDQMERMMDHN